MPDPECSILKCLSWIDTLGPIKFSATSNRQPPASNQSGLRYGLWTKVITLCYELTMACLVPTRFGLAWVLSLIIIGCAGRPSGPSETFGRSSDLKTNASHPDAGDAAVAIDASLSANDIHYDAGVSDPSRLLNDSDQREVIAPNSAGPLGASGLVLHVAERGPNKPWIIGVSNEGNAPAVLVADTRLLWLDVAVPGSKKAVNCSTSG